MSRICRACSTANDPDATACATCGEELPAERIEALTDTAPRVDPPVGIQRPGDSSHMALHLVAGGHDVRDARAGDMDEHTVERPAAEPFSEPAPTYVPTFTAGMLDDPRHLEGIGGWLLFVALIVVATPVVLLVSMIRSYAPIFLRPGVWELLQEQPRLHTLVVAEAAGNVVSFFIALALLFLFFGKRRLFPSFMIFYLVLHAALLIADLVFAHIVVPGAQLAAQDAAAAARSLLLVVILIPYLLRSRRVKATFVN